MKSIAAVVGPTASGKTALAIELAIALETEIVSADSMQLYRGMEIGTGAPTPEELTRVKHHFVGILDPSAEMSAANFEARAREIVAGLNAQGKPAVVAGGSGLYIRALIDGLFDGPGSDPATRKRLQNEAETKGTAALYQRLREVDPDYADTIQGQDLRRIVRALEVYEIAGKPLSILHREHRNATQSLDVLQIAIDYPRAELYARIDARVDAMFAQGLIAEVQRLIDNGYEEDLHRLKSLGYREVLAHLRGECSQEEAAEQMKRHTRRYAKRQLTWFRADERIIQLDTTQYATTSARAKKALALLEER